MSNIDKQWLRQLAVDAKELAIIKRYTKGIEAQKKFIAAMTPALVLALLDELEAAEKIAQQQGNIAVELFDEVTKLRRNADDSAPELRVQLEDAERWIAELQERRKAEPIYQLWDEGFYDTDKDTYDVVGGSGARGRIVYTAPPAPANAEPVAWLWSNRKHPSEVTLVRPEDDEKAEGAHWSGWSCKALYAEPPAPVSVPDDRYQHLSELYHAQEKRLFKLAQRIKGPSFDKYAHSPSQAIDVLESAIFGEREDDYRAAMLQGTDSNSLVVQSGWVACSERMPEDEQEVITHNIFGYRHVSFFDEHSGHFFDRLDGSPVDCVEHVLVSHWMPLPAAPQQEVKP